VKQYLYIYDCDKYGTYSSHSFAQKVLNNELDLNNMIPVENFMCPTDYGKVIYNNDIYSICGNVLKDNINYLIVMK
jgi:ArsR family metal-binding transcriptional regulator